VIRALILVAALEAAPAQEQNPPDSLRAALEEERVARLMLEAARSKEFYLLVDVSGSTLSLNLSGITLATYRLESVELGLPLSVTEPRGDELEALFTCEPAVAEAPREIQPGPAPSPAEAQEQPPPEEEPRRKRLHLECEPPLSVHLVSGGSGIRERMRLPWDRERDLRVRVVVAEEDAARLLPSVGQKTLLLFSLAPAKAQPGGAPAPR
jgi:hypothetical protein